MDLITILCIIIAILSVALIIAIVCVVLLNKALKGTKQQLSWYDRSHR